MGGKTPETCWAVNKRQDNKLENCFNWLVIYLNFMFVLGTRKHKAYSVRNLRLFERFIWDVRLFEFFCYFFFIWSSCDRASWQISYNKTKYMHWFLKFILRMKFYMFRTVPLSNIGSFSLYTQQRYICQQTCITYTIAVCTVKNTWWWIRETVRNM
jgi:hypothetical protein